MYVLFRGLLSELALTEWTEGYDWLYMTPCHKSQRSLELYADRNCHEIWWEFQIFSRQQTDKQLSLFQSSRRAVSCDVRITSLR